MSIKYDKTKLILPDDVSDIKDVAGSLSDYDKGHSTLDLKVKANANASLINALSNKDGSQTMAAMRRAENMATTKGMNKTGTMQETHMIPVAVWHFACLTYGEKRLYDDYELWNTIFEPWRVVDSSRIRKRKP